MLEVREINTERDIKRFIDLPWTLYGADPNWVPPLKREMREILLGPHNPLFHCGPHALFLALEGETVVGRVMTAVDEELNAARGRGWGYFSLFECIERLDVASALLEAAEKWLSARGARICRGPVSPDNGDDYRGLLVEGFDTPPVLMDSYNPRFYADFIEACGYAGDGDDRLAYIYRMDSATQEKTVATIEYAKKRWGFRVDRVNLKDLDNEFKALKEIVDAAMPEWFDMVPPSMDEIQLMAKKILPVVDPDFIYLARDSKGAPIGFLLGLPDYNQALKYTNGSLFPFGWAKFLWYKRKIKSIRIFVLFVVPAFQKKAVSHAMFLEAFLACKRRGYEWAEGSTILSSNTPMNRDAVGAGGKVYKVFRTYEKVLS